MYSCQQTSEAREEELRRVIARETLVDCPVIRLRQSGSEPTYDIHNSLQTHQRAVEPTIENAIDYGGWLSTIVFLSIALIFAVVSAVMSLVNILFNPVEPVLRYDTFEDFLNILNEKETLKKNL